MGSFKFRQILSMRGSSTVPPRYNNERVSHSKPQKGNCIGSLLPTCTRYGKKHEGKCLAGTNGYFSYRKSGHKMRDFPINKSKVIDGKQDPLSGLRSNARKQNQLYVLRLMVRKRVLLMWLVAC